MIELLRKMRARRAARKRVRRIDSLPYAITVGGAVVARTRFYVDAKEFVASAHAGNIMSIVREL